MSVFEHAKRVVKFKTLGGHNFGMNRATELWFGMHMGNTETMNWGSVLGEID